MRPLILPLLSAVAASAAEDACAGALPTHGCDPFCGYEALRAGDDFLCLPSRSGPARPFPATVAADDRDDYCALVAANYGCNELCGFRWDSAVGECVAGVTRPGSASGDVDASAAPSAPIIGGQGDYRYEYMPELLKAPAGAVMQNCHGLVTDKDKNIYLTYQNDAKTDANCLIRWKPDGTAGEFMTAGGTALCSGTPHGLKIATEANGEQFLYHANNNQKLTKTHLNGSIVWQVNGLFGQNTTVYRPTWFAVPPGSETIYLCDGYGSNNVYAFDRMSGKFLNHTWGGKSPTKGPNAPHGTFSTNHGCTYDSRLKDTIVVSDRANSRLEFFHYDPATSSTFEWYKTHDLQPQMGTQTLPCNLRMYPEQDGRGIIPDLSGPVAVVDKDNTVVSVVNVSVLLAAEQHKHPHDAIFLPNGDMVVATWFPGRISYWRRLPAEPYCVHTEDIVDHKCMDACAKTEFEMTGVASPGKCPAKYNTVDKTVTETQCPDGKTQLRYCPGKAVDVTSTTRGESRM